MVILSEWGRLRHHRLRGLPMPTMNPATRRVLILCCLLLSWALPIHAQKVRDQVGRQIRVPANPRRVIALAPSLTEIVFDLGEGARLVGVTQFSDSPSEAKSLPRVGSYVRLDLERIVGLSPDLCLGIRDGNPGYQVERIEAAGIPVYVTDPRDIKGIMAAIRGVGVVLGVPAKAAALNAEMAGHIERVRQQVASTLYRPRVFFQVDASPLITAGSNTLINELISLAGGINLGAGPQDYPRFSWEQVLALNPEVVLISSMAGGHDSEQLKDQWRQWSQLSAVRSDRIHVVDAELFDRPTPRLLNGLETLVRIIHPELFEAAHGR